MFIADQILASTIRVSISDPITGIGEAVSLAKQVPYRSIGPLLVLARPHRRLSHAMNRFASARPASVVPADSSNALN
jgi:hypothetical protein